MGKNPSHEGVRSNPARRGAMAAGVRQARRVGLAVPIPPDWPPRGCAGCGADTLGHRLEALDDREYCCIDCACGRGCACSRSAS